MNYPKRTDILLGAATLALTALFFVPFSLYLLNKEAFFTSPLIVAGVLLAFSAACFVVLSLPLLFAKGMTRVIAISLLAFLTIGLWAQANLLNWDYGLLDGSALRWRLLERRSFIDVSVWALLLASIMTLGIVKKASFRTAFLVLLFMQSGNILYTWLPTHNASQKTSQNLSITTTDRFVFSQEKNIILLVLDGYQSDIFNEYLENNPNFKDKLPGFSYYPNAVAEHFYTLRSIATLLTGNHIESSAYENGSAQKKHRNDLFMHRSIPAMLKKSGYHVGLYPFYARNNYPPEIFGGSADNYLHANVLLEEGSNELASLMSVSLFRIAPHLLKNMIHSRFLLSPSYEQDRDEFTFDMQNQLRVGIEEPAFKYYHLQGMHGPHIINGERADAESRTSALNIAALVNQMLADFIARLQVVDAYDNADIFVVADHGLYHDSKRLVFGDFRQDISDRDRPPLDDFVKKCRALPLFLYKPAHATGTMDTAQTPVCLADVLPTVLDIAAIKAPEDIDGVSIRELQEDTTRTRSHFTNELHRQRSIIPDYEFVVSGFSWYDSAWAYTGNLHSYSTIERIPLNNYATGTPLSFGYSGNGREYLDGNWNSDEKYHWTNSKRASLTLPLANPSKNMVLMLEIAPGNTDTRTVSLYINGTNAGVFHVQGKTLLTIDVPYDPAWKNRFLKTDAEPEDDLWAWSPRVPVLSDARVTLRIQAESNRPDSTTITGEIALKLFSLRLDKTPAKPQE